MEFVTMTSLKKKWEENKKASTTIWGADWSYIRKQQDTVDRWDENEATTYKI